MVQESSVAIIGAGAAGCVCAYFLQKSGIIPTIFDFGLPLRTLLPTGGGRCNLAHAEYDFKELAKNYPRGEKFLYSVFSKFGTEDTIALFEEIGVKTYIQNDGRIFPVSNSSKIVREKILSTLKDINFIKEKVIKISKLENGYKVKTTKAEYFFSKIVLSTGGRTKIDGIEKQTVTEFYPSLVGLNTEISTLGGIVLNDVYSKDFDINGNILFTHFGVSGPLIYTISSLKAKDKFPYKLSFDLYPKDINLQDEFNRNPHKELKNILSEYFPKRFAEFISEPEQNTKCHLINGKTRDSILHKIHNFELIISGTNKGEETVTCGGYSLDNISPKTMESKIYEGLYIIGEALDIDGFCGGFNLQNAWSTAFIASQGICEKLLG